MRWMLALLVHVVVMGSAAAQDMVHFQSFDAGEGRTATELTGYVFKPNRSGPMPAVVFLHGCGGLISITTHRIVSREVDWAAKLNAQGIAVLMIDSLTPRGSGEICSRTGFKEWLYLRRPADAYGGLAWLQQQPWVAKDRVAMIGWSIKVFWNARRYCAWWAACATAWRISAAELIAHSSRVRWPMPMACRMPCPSCPTRLA